MVRVLPEQAGTDGRLKTRDDRFVVRGGPVQQVGVHLGADDGAQVKHPQDRLGQRGEPLVECLAYSGGNVSQERVGRIRATELTRVVHEREKLDHRVRVAFAAPVQHLDDLRVHTRSCVCLDEGTDGLQGKPAEPQRLGPGAA